MFRSVSGPLYFCFIAAFACATATAADLSVMVRDVTGQPASDTFVCAGTPQQPAQFGSAKTNASGIAVLRGVPAQTVQVTAHRGLIGATLVYQVGTASAQSVALRLPATVTYKTCSAGNDANPPIGTAKIPQPSSPAPAELKLDKAQLPNERLTSAAPGRIPVKREYCFGALGAQCGGAQNGVPTHALCALGQCKINAGSWEHDQCCFAHPRGMACQAGPLDYATGHNGSCVTEWNKALARLSANLNWTRQVDFNRPNSTGRVEFDLYCAPTGTYVHQDDVRYCCSRQADPASVLSAITTLPGSVLRVCR